jgi:hypothetical protein
VSCALLRTILVLHRICGKIANLPRQIDPNQSSSFQNHPSSEKEVSADSGSWCRPSGLHSSVGDPQRANPEKDLRLEGSYSCSRCRVKPEHHPMHITVSLVLLPSAVCLPWSLLLPLLPSGRQSKITADPSFNVDRWADWKNIAGLSIVETPSTLYAVLLRLHE